MKLFIVLLLLLGNLNYSKNYILTHISADKRRTYAYRPPVPRADGISEFSQKDVVSNIYIGNVKLSIGNYEIHCDSAVFNDNSFIAMNNVRISNGSDSIISCASLVLKEGDNYVTMNNNIMLEISRSAKVNFGSNAKMFLDSKKFKIIN